MELIVLYTELLSIGRLALFKLLFFEMLDQCKPCVLQVCNLSLNWHHIYEIERITAIVKIQKRRKEVLQRLIVAVAIYV